MKTSDLINAALYKKSTQIIIILAMILTLECTYLMGLEIAQYNLNACAGCLQMAAGLG